MDKKQLDSDLNIVFIYKTITIIVLPIKDFFINFSITIIVNLVTWFRSCFSALWNKNGKICFHANRLKLEFQLWNWQSVFASRNSDFGIWHRAMYILVLSRRITQGVKVMYITNCKSSSTFPSPSLSRPSRISSSIFPSQSLSKPSPGLVLLLLHWISGMLNVNESKKEKNLLKSKTY